MATAPVGELLQRYDKPGPRYTSYPTAVEFHEGADLSAYEDHLARAAVSEEPLSLYLHLPFCEERCLFCGCNVVVTKHREIAERYLDVLAREVRQVARRLGRRRRVVQYHWGGGTPTYLAPEQMRALQRVVAGEFEIDPDGENAVEVDPRVTTPEHLAVLRLLGFNRLSLGVQDFTPAVQAAVLRIQPFCDTKELIDEARALGFGSINVDLIYGLPFQTRASFREMLDLVLQLEPDRLAVYSYAHVPWMRGHQKKIPEDSLPSAAEKLELFGTAFDVFTGAGYVNIGMDHFALPDDELGRAVERGTLGRNFMGYTVRAAPEIVACGLSAIGDLAGGYFQNHRKLHAYERAVNETGLAVERGYVCTRDDRLRRHVIASLMCGLRVDFADVERRFGVPFRETFARELEELEPLQEDGLVSLEAGGVRVSDLGRLFIRNIAMVFDAYLRQSRAPQFSRTV